MSRIVLGCIADDFTGATPAFPDNHRTVFKGQLFVGDVLLNESGMQNHPLTPMTDANLVRVLQGQCTAKAGLIDYKVVAQGEAAIRARVDQLRVEGVRLAVVHAISNDDLMRLGPALKDMAPGPQICRVGRSLFVRGYVHATAGIISVRLARLDANAQQVSGDKASKTIALHAMIYPAARRHPVLCEEGRPCAGDSLSSAGRPGRSRVGGQDD